MSQINYPDLNAYENKKKPLAVLDLNNTTQLIVANNQQNIDIIAQNYAAGYSYVNGVLKAFEDKGININSAINNVIFNMQIMFGIYMTFKFLEVMKP